ncbi:hypothetical protein CXP39_02625 [Mesoplasma syrphidae]|uniref:Uncharacterized protein n=1 Tax=Mesoplasma syrphidae TaxID=225999 RepID=A0A2K9BVD7_9MOLU|nr:hypothetical protein [Mesoplasma syrphidae]AUF83680.1 hypothetical protein CXP39_02625 [Mesoplasma syrphidae]
MFKIEFQKKLGSFANIATTEINDKVGRDFLKFLIISENLKISNELFEKMILSMKIVAAYNNHQFVRQSDLFAILELQQNEIANLNEIFEKALKATMFRELYIYLEANIKFKEQAANDFENDIITLNQIKEAQILSKWTSNKIEELESTIELVTQGEQLTNTLTGEWASEFYRNCIKEITTMMRWHLVGFEIIKNFNKK